MTNIKTTGYGADPTQYTMLSNTRPSTSLNTYDTQNWVNAYTGYNVTDYYVSNAYQPTIEHILGVIACQTGSYFPGLRNSAPTNYDPDFTPYERFMLKGAGYTTAFIGNNYYGCAASSCTGLAGQPSVIRTPGCISPGFANINLKQFLSIINQVYPNVSTTCTPIVFNAPNPSTATFSETPSNSVSSTSVQWQPTDLSIIEMRLGMKDFQKYLFNWFLQVDPNYLDTFTDQSGTTGTTVTRTTRYFALTANSWTGTTPTIDVRAGLKTFIDSRFNPIKVLIGSSTDVSTTTPLTLFSNFAITRSLIGLNTDNASQLTLFGGQASIKTLIGTTTDTSSQSTLFGGQALISNKINTLIGTSSDTSSQTTLFGRQVLLKNLIGAINDNASQSTLFGGQAALSNKIGTSSDTSSQTTLFGGQDALKKLINTLLNLIGTSGDTSTTSPLTLFANQSSINTKIGLPDDDISKSSLFGNQAKIITTLSTMSTSSDKIEQLSDLLNDILTNFGNPLTDPDTVVANVKTYVNQGFSYLQDIINTLGNDTSPATPDTTTVIGGVKNLNTLVGDKLLVLPSNGIVSLSGIKNIFPKINKNYGYYNDNLAAFNGVITDHPTNTAISTAMTSQPPTIPTNTATGTTTESDVDDPITPTKINNQTLYDFVGYVQHGPFTYTYKDLASYKLGQDILSSPSSFSVIYNNTIAGRVINIGCNNDIAYDDVYSNYNFLQNGKLGETLFSSIYALYGQSYFIGDSSTLNYYPKTRAAILSGDSSKYPTKALDDADETVIQLPPTILSYVKYIANCFDFPQGTDLTEDIIDQSTNQFTLFKIIGKYSDSITQNPNSLFGVINETKETLLDETAIVRDRIGLDTDSIDTSTNNKSIFAKINNIANNLIGTATDVTKSTVNTIFSFLNDIKTKLDKLSQQLDPSDTDDSGSGGGGGGGIVGAAAGGLFGGLFGGLSSLGSVMGLGGGLGTEIPVLDPNTGLPQLDSNGNPKKRPYKPDDPAVLKTLQDMPKYEVDSAGNLATYTSTIPPENIREESTTSLVKDYANPQLTPQEKEVFARQYLSGLDESSLVEAQNIPLGTEILNLARGALGKIIKFIMVDLLSLQTLEIVDLIDSLIENLEIGKIETELTNMNQDIKDIKDLLTNLGETNTGNNNTLTKMGNIYTLPSNSTIINMVSSSPDIEIDLSDFYQVSTDRLTPSGVRILKFNYIPSEYSQRNDYIRIINDFPGSGDNTFFSYFYTTDPTFPTALQKNPVLNNTMEVILPSYEGNQITFKLNNEDSIGGLPINFDETNLTLKLSFYNKQYTKFDFQNMYSLKLLVNFI